MVKCQWCKEEGFKDEMYVEAKDTGQVLKSGKPKLIRKYTHNHCVEAMLKDKEFKQQELKELDSLYQYLKHLHNIENLDGRMLEKIQDLRNGSVKVGSQKIIKYKDGVTYTLMLETYKYVEPNLHQVLHTMQFERKWNEFSYLFAIMNRSIAEVQSLERKKERAESFDKVKVEENDFVEFDFSQPVAKKKDKLDISEFL